jgi:hypothetical protein
VGVFVGVGVDVGVGVGVGARTSKDTPTVRGEFLVQKEVPEMVMLPA